MSKNNHCGKPTEHSERTNKKVAFSEKIAIITPPNFKGLMTLKATLAQLVEVRQSGGLSNRL